jgi:DNA-binding NarL/FixJ family response regulator
MEKTSETIRLFLVDSNMLFRRGTLLALVKHKDIEVLGHDDTGTDIFEKIEKLSPDVALVDINMPYCNGLNLTRQITQRCPQTSVVVLSPYEEENQLFQAIKAGAVAYISKNLDADELVNIVRRVAHGEHIITESILIKPKVAERVLKEFQDLSSTGIMVEPLIAPITPREMEVLNYVARGYGNKQIAYTLNICEQTIKHHITSILRKIDANDRTHAVVLAIRNGWLSAAGKRGMVDKGAGAVMV